MTGSCEFLRRILGQAPSPQILWAVSAFDSNWLAKISSTPRSSLTTITLWERPTPSPASQPRRTLNRCTNSERLHSGRGGVAESKIQPLLRDQCLAGQFGPLRQNVRAIPRAVLAWLAAHGFQPDLVCKSHWTAGKVGGRAHGAWDHEVFTRDLGWCFQVRRGPPGRSEERNGRQGGSACRWPQVFHTQAIRLRSMTLFNPVFNCVTPKVIKR